MEAGCRRLYSSFPCSVLPLEKNPSLVAIPIARNPSLGSSRVFFRCFSTKWRPRGGSGGGSYWDSNAESFRGERSKFSDQWVDEDDEEDDGDYGFRRREKRRRKWWSDRNTSGIDEGYGILEEAVDNIWILKVFSSFGWLLPAIIISFLLSTGPKAFLMALALPLGQSALAYAFDKLFGRGNDNPKRRSRTKRKPFSQATRTNEMSEEEEQEENTETRKRSVYQSWVAANDGLGEKKDNSRDASFGGWDDLDRQRNFNKGPPKRPTRSAGVSRGEVKGKLSRRGRNKSTPLLLRLLIAVFPFLGSWTKLL